MSKTATKYNNMKTIPISSIPEDEMEQAVREWAEGSPNMEKLLWACLNNGVETAGCHADKRPYLEIRVNNSYDKVKKMLHRAQEFDGADVYISPDGGNPRSGPNWYKPSLMFGFSATDRKSADDIFDKMSESLTDESTRYETKDEVFEHILDFYDFFAGKESGCNFRIKNASGQYVFSIESFRGERNFDYFNSLFEKSGLNRAKKDPIDSPVDDWVIDASTPEEFNEKMIKCKDIIMREWSLGLPCEITKDMDFNTIARIKKREFGDTSEGVQKFEEWLQEENDRISKSIESHRNKSFMDCLKSQVNNSDPTTTGTSPTKQNTEKEKNDNKDKNI